MLLHFDGTEEEKKKRKIIDSDISFRIIVPSSGD